jgi:hypothetical protein
MVPQVSIFVSRWQSVTSVSREQVVASKPLCTIMDDNSTPTARQKQKLPETSTVTRNALGPPAGGSSAGVP